MFGTILISVVSCMHIYVFWRSASLPFLKRHVSRIQWVGVGLMLWGLFFMGRTIGHDGTGATAGVLEFLGMIWMAALFLMFIPLLLVDILSLFGFLMPCLSPWLRGGALLVGAVLSLIALFQGLRPPVIRNYEVRVPGLAGDLDGTVLAALSDMHLGAQLGASWLEARIEQVMALEPDLVVLLGDIFEGHGPPEDSLVESFKRIRAPLGTWAVTGNHEFHGNSGSKLFERMGFTLLRDRWIEPKGGLILAGVDDLTTQFRSGRVGAAFAGALAERPGGGMTILLSHTPWQAEQAAQAGVDLMLSGHTHGGQLWPFDYLVRRRYPLLEGRYAVNGMTVIVSRGAGTWGPRMRLWHPGEILKITLHAEK